MKYNDNTLRNLMTLLDEHKGDVTEGEYIEMCNLLKDVHELSNIDIKKLIRRAAAMHQQVPPRVPPQIPRVPPQFPPGRPRGNIDRITIPSEFDIANRRVDILRREVELAQVHINNPRVLNSHRQAVIEDLTQQHFRGPRGGLKMLTNSEIEQHVQDLITRELIVDQHDFVMKCLEKASDQAMCYLRRQRVLLHEALTTLEILRRQRNALRTDN